MENSPDLQTNCRILWIECLTMKTKYTHAKVSHTHTQLVYPKCISKIIKLTNPNANAHSHSKIHMQSHSEKINDMQME